MFSKAPVLHVPERFKTAIPAFVLSRLEAYFNQRDGNVLNYPYVRHILQNNLQEAIDTALYVGTLSSGHLPDQRNMIFSTVELLQYAAPDIAYGNKRRVMNWIAGYNQKPTPKLFQPITTEHLDSLLKDNYPPIYLISRAINYHGKQIGYMDIDDDGNLAIRLVLNCAVCSQNPRVAFAKRGADWTKMVDEAGREADLSRHTYVCSNCVYSKEGAKKMLVMGLNKQG